MTMSIRTNVGSLNAQRNLFGTQNQLSNTLSKLSSGYRITKAGDDAAGIASLRDAVRLAPDYAEARANLGAALTPTDPDTAIRELERAVALAPASLNAQFNLAVAYGASPALGVAKEIEQLRKVIALSPTFARAHLALGKLAPVPFNPAQPPLARIDVTFEDDLRVGGHLEVHGAALDHLHAPLAQHAGEQQLVEAFRHGRRGRNGGRGAPAPTSTGARTRSRLGPWSRGAHAGG